MTLYSSNVLLLVTRREFMNMTSKLPNNLANGAPKMSQNRKNHVEVRKKSSWYSSFSSITMVWFTMNSFQRVKRSIRNTTWPFWGVYVKQFVINGQICRQKIHGFFTTIMCRHIPAWLWLNFWLNTKQRSLLSHRIRKIWHHLQYTGCTADLEQPLHRFRAYRCTKVRGKCCSLCAIQLLRQNWVSSRTM